MPFSIQLVLKALQKHSYSEPLWVSRARRNESMTPAELLHLEEMFWAFPPAAGKTSICIYMQLTDSMSANACSFHKGSPLNLVLSSAEDAVDVFRRLESAASADYEPFIRYIRYIIWFSVNALIRHPEGSGVCGTSIVVLISFICATKTNLWGSDVPAVCTTGRLLRGFISHSSGQELWFHCESFVITAVRDIWQRTALCSYDSVCRD